MTALTSRQVLSSKSGSNAKYCHMLLMKSLHVVDEITLTGLPDVIKNSFDFGIAFNIRG